MKKEKEKEKEKEKREGEEKEKEKIPSVWTIRCAVQERSANGSVL